MSDFRIRETGEVVSQGELRRRNSNTSFPAVWDQAVFEFLQVDPVFFAPQPSNTDPLKTIRKNGVVQDGQGRWIENWEVVDLFTGDITDKNNVTKTKAEQETEYLAKRNADQWAAVRNTRDNKLKETDWMTNRAADTGTPMATEWATYRQALRDITTQTDPFNITWPVAPTE